MSKKIFLCQLDRFGYYMSVISETREDGIRAIKKEYRRAFRNLNNGNNPPADLEKWALEEIRITETEINSVFWD